MRKGLGEREVNDDVEFKTATEAVEFYKAEVKRLRGALEEIATWEGTHPGDIARAALDGEKR